MAEIKFEIKQTAGVISESAKGWKKELNLISWNEKEAKYDIRDWDSKHRCLSRRLSYKNLYSIFSLFVSEFSINLIYIKFQD